MKVEFKSSFSKDLRKIKVEKYKVQVKEVIEQLEQAENLQQVENLKSSGEQKTIIVSKWGIFELG